MTAFVNPIHGDDATARFNDRARPWKTHEAAFAALEAARDRQSAEPGGIREPFRMVETHKPIKRSAEDEPVRSDDGSADTSILRSKTAKDEPVRSDDE